MTQPGIKPRSPEPLVNTVTITPMSGDILDSWLFKIVQDIRESYKTNRGQHEKQKVELIAGEKL